jgi:16S rRNA (guanine1207-N2)-methyltransferase
MSHYFLHDEELKNNEYDVNFSFNGHEFHLVSNNGVFSKKRIDEGSFILINSLLSQNINGNVLDLGCGYGPVGITLKYFFQNIKLVMSDVNSSCIDLALKNSQMNNINAQVVLSDGFINLKESFDWIVFNPPIRIGKEKLFNIYKDAFMHLNQNGKFVIVIRKDKGALSHARYLETLFKSVDLVERKSGYYVYVMNK